MRRVRLPILATLALLWASPVSAADFAVEITASSLNVRDQAWGRVLGQVARGVRLVASDQQGDWLEVSWQGRHAWISASYARRVSAPWAVVDTDGLNVRTGPGAGHSRFGMIARGQAYVRLETRAGDGGDWHLLQFDHRRGWVAAWLTREVGAATPSSSTPSASTPRPSGGDTWHARMSATADELEVLARICKGEASVTSYEGKVAVCAVVLNRVRSSRFPNSIRGVAHQPWQFSAYNPDVRGRLYWGQIPQACWDAAREALAGRDPVHGATFYFNPYLVRPSWARGMSFIRRIGTSAVDTHDFYRP